jgi:hypothetical protein
LLINFKILLFSLQNLERSFLYSSLLALEPFLCFADADIFFLDSAENLSPETPSPPKVEL